MEQSRDPFAGRLYSGVSHSQWLTTHIIAVCVTAASLTCSVYHIYRTILNWRVRKLRTMQRLPMWTSVADALFAFLHGLDHAVSLSTGYVSTGPFCQFLGWSMIYVMNTSTFWVTTIAFYLWKMVVRNRDLDAGKYDWKLHVWNWGVPMIWAVFPEITGDYGQEVLWCGVQGNLFLWNGCIVLVGVAASGFFYGHLAWFLHGHRKVMRDVSKGKLSAPKDAASSAAWSRGKSSTLEEGKPQPKAKDRVAMLVSDLPVYVAVSVFQWSPYLVYSLLPATEAGDYILDVIVTTATNARGIVNTFAYLRFMQSEHRSGEQSDTSSPALAANGASAAASARVLQSPTAQQFS